MGLDMYLEMETTFYKPFTRPDEKPKKTKEETNRQKIIKMIGAENLICDNLGYVSISFEVAYWRKANAIHNWFVQNVQDGEDDCKRYYVSREKLTELRDACQQVIDAGKIKENVDDIPEIVQISDVLAQQVEEALEEKPMEHPLGGIGAQFIITDDPELLQKIEAWNEANQPKLIPYDQLDVAEELLPTTEGFFFGSTEYDEWYMEDIKYTAERLTTLLNEAPDNVEFYYRASW